MSYRQDQYDADRIHPCDACGGTGYTIREQVSGAFPIDCHVCLGAGSFPDRMPARDALADAETLLSALKVCKHDTVQCYVDGAWASARAIAGEIEPSGMWAERAARAAFRAVPALRGEE